MTMGEPAQTTISWNNLQAGQTYLARIDYGNGTDTVGTTLLTVRP